MHMRAGCLRAVTVLVAACALGGLAACAPGAAGGSGARSTAGSAQAAGSDEIVYVPTVNGGGEDSPEPSATETASSEQGAHDFECEWFYVDVPDSWVRDDSGRELVEGGPVLWSVEEESATDYYFWQSERVGTEPDGSPLYSTGAIKVHIGNAPGPSWEFYGYAAGDTPVYITKASASFLADEYSDGAVLTLKTSGSSASASQAPAQSDDEATFVATARAALKVPDDPSITYEISGPSYWEGAGIYVTNVECYQNGELVATALCGDDGSPARNIMQYTAP